MNEKTKAVIEAVENAMGILSDEFFHIANAGGLWMWGD
jgi:hypothetical protein